MWSERYKSDGSSRISDENHQRDSHLRRESLSHAALMYSPELRLSEKSTALIFFA
ncbi:hypothetical protein Hanom_Chr16g01480681 [Helianthus anomalus]